MTEKKIIDLLNILDVKRFDNYDDWIKIGMILKSLNNIYIDTYIEYSKKSAKYTTATDVMEKWKSFKKGKLTVATIIKMAQEDNSEKAKEWMREHGDRYKTKEERKQDIIIEMDEYYMKTKEEAESLTFGGGGLFMVHSPLCYCMTRGGVITKYKKNDIKDILKYLDKPEYKFSFFDRWLNDADRAQYYKFDFDPSMTQTAIYNSFTGFKYNNDMPINNKKLDVFINTIEDLFMHNKDNIKIFFDWIAWIRQRPHRKTNTAIILYSDNQGVGKNTLTKFISDTLGYSTCVNNIEDLTKNFNSHISNKLLIIGDEVKAKAKSMRDELKNIITREKMICEEKGINSYEISDYSNYIFTTNNINSFHIEETDRRFILLNMKEERMSKELSNTLYELLDDGEVLYSFDTFLKNRIIPDRLEPPMNDYKKSIINSSLPAYIKMIYTCYQNYANRKVRLSEIQHDAIEYGKKNYIDIHFTAQKLAKDFKIEFNEYFTKGREYNYYEFPDIEILLKALKKKRPDLIIDL